ncbi:MAG: ABC transporter permease [Betaproteobacteria bacterium]|jgi:putative ABC transport system permease protein
MVIPYSYTVKNLGARKLTTALTAAGMALVVFVFATVLMLQEGLKKTLVDTGSPDNVVVTRRSAGTEVQSGIDRVQAAVVESQPEIAYGTDGRARVSKEMVVLITLLKRDSGKPSNVIIRGVGPQGRDLRPQVRIVQGRMFRAGSSEIIAGSGIAARFRGAGAGEQLRFGMRDWTVVGIFDANNSGFDSEIWGDVEQLMQAFRRPVFSSLVLKLNDPARFEGFKQRIESDPRLTVETKRESVFYAEQSEVLANFIGYLGLTLSVIFSIGATIGAMITMYASVASRTAEIGTLRALGFRRSGILAVFLLEALLLGLIGGGIGLILASFMQFLTISTMNWQSFSELAFSFRLNPAIIAKSLAFALFMGLLGGFLPAARASRLNIVDSLRAP